MTVEDNHGATSADTTTIVVAPDTDVPGTLLEVRESSSAAVQPARYRQTWLPPSGRIGTI